MLVTTLPVSCRTMLDEKKGLSDDEVEALWKKLKRVQVLSAAGPALPNGEDRFGDEYCNAIAGSATVILGQKSWCESHSEEAAECEALVRHMVASPPPRGILDSVDNVSTWTWDCFLAEAAVALWASNPKSHFWREAVVRSVISTKHVALRQLFKRCEDYRKDLADDIGRLRCIAVEWAFIPRRVDFIRRQPGQGREISEELRASAPDKFQRWLGEKVEPFGNGTASELPDDWLDVDPSSDFGDLDAALPR